MSNSVGIGIIGMGFMGQTHARAFLRAGADGVDCELRGVCDRDPDRRAGIASAGGNMKVVIGSERLFESGSVEGHPEVGTLLADPSISLVSICTHTDSHVDLAIRALDAGKHVLVEKPVAIRLTDIERLRDHAGGSNRLCIPAMCIRHWPGWSDLRSMVQRGEHGRVVHARFERLGAPPAWAGDFYADPARSGGAIFDLHVHDADFARSLFGNPHSVSSIGDAHHIATQYHFAGGPAVAAEGGWMNDPAFPFRMAFCVEFERAVVVFNSADDPVMTLHKGGRSQPIVLPDRTGYDEQARAVVRAILDPARAEGLPNIEDAHAVTRIIEAERVSAAEGRPVALEW